MAGDASAMGAGFFENFYMTEFLRLFRMTVFKRYTWPIFVFAAILLSFAGCKEGEGDDSVIVSLRAETVTCNTTTNRILATGDAMTYVATILSQDAGDAWCSFASFDTSAAPQLSKTGRVGMPMTVYLRRNESDEDRTATIETLFADGTLRRLSFTQQAYSETASYDRQWGEQPFYRENDTYIYKTYYTTLTRGGYVRNYSICFDIEKRVSHWVAYPLTTNYVTPNIGRTDAWSYDPNNQLPKILQSEQSDPTKTYGTGDARGHQLPSADRYSNRETNAMTFYATNIMPQNYKFNGGIWVQLESKVRENMQSNPSDTLFVVTGTYFAGNKTIKDRDGKTVGYPSNCWKVLLRGSKGKAVWNCSADELYSIGFWLANDESNTEALRSYATTVADIEEKTGFTFFRNIPSEAAEAVKSQNRPVDWRL